MRIYVRFSENRFYRLRTTFTGDSVDREKRKKVSVFEVWSGTRCKKTFDDPMSESMTSSKYFFVSFKKTATVPNWYTFFVSVGVPVRERGL